MPVPLPQLVYLIRDVLIEGARSVLSPTPPKKKRSMHPAKRVVEYEIPDDPIQVDDRDVFIEVSNVRRSTGKGIKQPIQMNGVPEG